MSLTGPINGVPYDILREIFIKCLPQYALDNPRQPNLQVAPMLLCHVCASWRKVALSCTVLWTHLSFHFIIKEIKPNFASWAFLRSQIDFIRWWNKNQGSIPPILIFEIGDDSLSKEKRKMKQEDLIAWKSVEDFISTLLMSAQYLDVDLMFWAQIHDRVESGHQISFPELKSLVRKFKYHLFLSHLFLPAQVDTPKLRHLCITKVRSFARPEIFIEENIAPVYWSTLTRISLHDVCIDATLWYFLIRALPQLQWGYFSIFEICMESNQEIVEKLSTTTLSTLSNLFLLSTDDDCPLQILLTGLHLPTLQTLSLLSYAESWSDERALADLSAILDRAPNIKILCLDDNFISVNDPDYIVPDRAEPIWNCAPGLEHLQFEILFPVPGDKTVAQHIDRLIKNIFSPDNRWLDLKNSSCPIRKITLIDSAFGLDCAGEFVTSRVEALAKKMPRIDFEITSTSPQVEGGDAWKEWGA